MVPLGLAILGLLSLLLVALWTLLRQDASMPSQPQAQAQATIERRPDLPRPFGLRTAWLAVRTADLDGLIEMLELSDITPANWHSGLQGVTDAAAAEGPLARAVFVTPAVEGWIFVIGNALPIPAGQRFEDALTPLMERLGAIFVEVQAYHCYPDLDLFAWARIVDGKLVRAFAWSDEGLVWNRGRVSKEELQLGLGLFGLRAASSRDADGGLHGYPDAAHVMTMAQEWSLDPTGLAQLASISGIRPGLGRLGQAPDTWRLRRKPRPPRPTGGDRPSLAIIN